MEVNAVVVEIPLVDQLILSRVRGAGLIETESTPFIGEVRSTCIGRRCQIVYDDNPPVGSDAAFIIDNSERHQVVAVGTINMRRRNHTRNLCATVTKIPANRVRIEHTAISELSGEINTASFADPSRVRLRLHGGRQILHRSDCTTSHAAAIAVNYRYQYGELRCAGNRTAIIQVAMRLLKCLGTGGISESLRRRAVTPVDVNQETV